MGGTARLDNEATLPGAALYPGESLHARFSFYANFTLITHTPGKLSLKKNCFSGSGTCFPINGCAEGERQTVKENKREKKNLFT